MASDDPAHRHKRPPRKKKPRAVEAAAAAVVHTPEPESDGKRPPTFVAHEPETAAQQAAPPLCPVEVAPSRVAETTQAPPTHNTKGIVARVIEGFMVLAAVVSLLLAADWCHYQYLQTSPEISVSEQPSSSSTDFLIRNPSGYVSMRNVTLICALEEAVFPTGPDSGIIVRPTAEQVGLNYAAGSLRLEEIQPNNQPVTLHCDEAPKLAGIGNFAMTEAKMRVIAVYRTWMWRRATSKTFFCKTASEGFRCSPGQQVHAGPDQKERSIWPHGNWHVLTTRLMRSGGKPCDQVEEPYGVLP
jgi:hypothetical protein